MRIVKVLPSFERTVNKISDSDKEKLKKTLHQFNDFLVSKILPKGLGLKKLAGNIYELRIDVRLRLILQMDEEAVYLVLIGSHDDIRRYLKTVR